MATPAHSPDAPATPPASVWETREAPSEAALATLWLRMIEIYGQRWVSQYGEIPDSGLSGAMRTWRRGLCGIGAREIGLGLRKCVQSGAAWPPSLPEFRALCTATPADFGLPEPEAALAAAVRGLRDPAWHPTHPALERAARLALADPSRPWHERHERFLSAYAELTRRVMAGDSLDRPIVLPEKNANQADADEVRHHLARIRELLTGRAPATRIEDHVPAQP